MENGEREKERILLAGLVSHKSSNFIKREGPWAAIVKKWVSRLIPLEFNREGPSIILSILCTLCRCNLTFPKYDPISSSNSNFFFLSLFLLNKKTQNTFRLIYIYILSM